jgi:hypothetical protein
MIVTLFISANRVRFISKLYVGSKMFDVVFLSLPLGKKDGCHELLKFQTESIPLPTSNILLFISKLTRFLSISLCVSSSLEFYSFC